MKQLLKHIDKIGDSVWFMTIGLIGIPFWLYSEQNSRFVYWMLASYLYIGVIKDFLKAIIKKLKKKDE